MLFSPRVTKHVFTRGKRELRFSIPPGSRKLGGLGNLGSFHDFWAHFTNLER